MNKRGFAATGILYTILVLFILLIFGMITMLYSRNNILNRIQQEIKGNLSYINDVYANGTAVYFNPETGSICDPNDAVSATGTKTGCMKWYTFNDSSSSTTVNMILDHNTTATVAWNSSGSNSEMNEVAAALTSDTSTWASGLNPRLITADEIAQITGNTTFSGATSTYSDWFFLDSNSQTQTATTQGASNYAWLYDYTLACLQDGCNISGAGTNAYWTSTPVEKSSNYAWYISQGGRLFYYYSVSEATTYLRGVRPVITIDKSLIDNSEMCTQNVGKEYVFDYTGGEQQFIAPCDGTYKLETWGASGGYAYDSNRSTGNGGYGGYSVGVYVSTSSHKLYVNIGGQGESNCQTTSCSGGYNGGSNSTKWAYGDGSGLYTGGGGGATHIATVSGKLSVLENLKGSVLLVSGGGGGGDYYSAWSNQATGGSGGGYIGNNSIKSEGLLIMESTGGTQTSGYGFGMAGTTMLSDSTGGSGGGWYGGITNNSHTSGAGGSGYIGSSYLISDGGITKHMTCYNCSTSNDTDTRTQTTTNVSTSAISDYAKSGNGYAKITLLSVD